MNINNRPINLQLTTIKFPITAIVSILHRISGFALFVVLPIFLYYLNYSLSNEANFLQVKSYLSHWQYKAFVWLVLSGLVYHLVAGVRHLCMDCHIGDSKKGGKIGAYIVLLLTVVLSLTIGVYLW